ncbi:MAG: hypothetical protein SGILL_009706 [Bacillariaceae sp.]
MGRNDERHHRFRVRKGKEEVFQKLPTYRLVKDCTDDSHPKRLHGRDMFAGILRNALRQSKNDLGQPIPSYLNKPFVNGLQVPYQVRDHPDHGRGLYAVDDIPQGTLVWQGELASFDHPRDFVAFLRYLPQDLQCDVILWAYPVQHSRSKVMLAMDEGSYMNDAGKDANCGGNVPSTLRNIDVGEELVEDYSTYLDFEGSVVWFHSLREHVFGGGGYTDQGAPTGTAENDDGGDDDYEKYFRIDITSSAMGSVTENLFDEVDSLDESPRASQGSLNLSKGMLVCVAAVLVKRRLFGRNKMHGL